MSNKIDNLLKQDDSSEELSLTSKKLTYSKRKINGICRSLSIPSKDYKAQKSIDSINSYLSAPDRIDRILYSEISNYIFSLDIASRGTFVTNVENLLHYALNDINSVSDNCQKIVIKIYDHSQLALYQIENTNNIFADSIEEAKSNLEKSIKGIEKEYISILGIFASIVFAFVGSITFSASVLQNISSGSIYRLVLIVDLLAFVFLNIIYMLIRFVYVITEKDYYLFKITWVNIVCLTIAVLTVIAWALNADELPRFLRQFLPWVII